MAISADVSRLARIGKLSEVQQDLIAKLHDVQIEIHKLATGQDATGDVLKRLEGAFSCEWQARYGSPYSFQFAKDRAQWKLKMKIATEADIQQRIMSYFHQPDDYTAKAKHSFGLFISRFNSLVGAPTVIEVFGPCAAEGKHIPPCKNDQEHTSRYMKEMRQ